MRQPIRKVSDLSYRRARKQQTLVSLSLSLSGLSIVTILYFTPGHRKLPRSGLVSFFTFQEPHVKSEPASPGLWSVTKQWKPGWKPYPGELLTPTEPLLPSQSDDWPRLQLPFFYNYIRWRSLPVADMTNMMKIDQTIISRSFQYTVCRQDEFHDGYEALR